MRPVILFAAFRPFDLRLVLDSGVVQHLTADFSVVVLGPPGLEKTFADLQGEGVRFEPLLYRTGVAQGIGDLAEARPGLRGLLRSQFEQCLRLVYGRPPSGPENLTGILHRKTFRQGLRERRLTVQVAGYVVLTTAWLAGHSRLLRRLLQRLYILFTDFQHHRALLRELWPSLVVLPSAGLSIDGWLMAEARRAGVPVAVLSQSWDRTSSKGYPTSPPDYVVVWSDGMKREVVWYWDVPAERVFVEGAPPWDGHFSAPIAEPRAAFLAARALNSAAKTIYVALTGPAWHENNKLLVDTLIQLRREIPELHGINLLVRVHPNYLGRALARRFQDLMAHLDGCKDEPAFHIDIPDVRPAGDTFVVGERYESELRSLLMHADVMVSVPSSQLIEAAIFDLPYVELNYGRWKNEVLDVDLGSFVLEHFVRLRRHGAGALCNRPQDLGWLLVEELKHPERRRHARAALAEQEAGANRGCAAEATAARLRRLVKSCATVPCE